jgi:hypothetical protein
MSTIPQYSTLTHPQLTDIIKRSQIKALEELPQPMVKSGIYEEISMPMNTGKYRRLRERITGSQYAKTRDE